MDDANEPAHAHEGHNSAAQLKQIIGRIQKLHEERKALASDISDCLSEAASVGFDKKAIKAVIAYLNKDRAERESHDQIVQTYLVALGEV